VPLTATIAVRDDHDRRPEIKLEALTANEMNDVGLDVIGVEFGTDDRRFRLRAGRDGRRGRQARIYEVVYAATAWAGHKTFPTTYVIVPRNPQ
jgi:hypothetical protein